MSNSTEELLINHNVDDYYDQAVAIVVDTEIVDSKPFEIYIGFFDIDLTNDYEQSILNIIGAITKGYDLRIFTNTPDAQEEFGDFLDPEMRLKFETIEE